MSTDYLCRLEQRRAPQPSTQVIDSLARALRLTSDERDYLYRTSGHNTPDRTMRSTHVAPALLRVMDRLADTPAVILSDVGETLVQNEPARALFGDPSARTGLDRSDVYRWFAHPETARAHYPPDDHARQGRAMVANLRAAYGRSGPKSRAGEIVADLQVRSTEFTEMWERHEVAVRFADHKVLLHPEIGAIEVDCQALFTEDQSQTLLVLTAPARTEAAEKLALLTVVGSQRFAHAE